MQISNYIDAATRRPWIYGGGPGGFRGHDCTLFLANWVLARSGQDPADDLRGTYDDEAGARAVVDTAGGFVQLIGARVTSLGWRSVKEPQDGDIAAFTFPLRQGQHFKGASIRVAGRWIAADPKRLLTLPSSAFCEAIWSPR